MIKYTFTISLLFFVISSFAQNYKVIHVKGEIQTVSTSELLNRGDDFTTKETFTYLTNGARAVVVNTSEGKRMILQKATGGGSSALAGLTPSMGNISSRSGALINPLDVKNYFGSDLVILDEFKIQINSSTYPQNEKQFFFLEYVYSGDTINKKLNFSADTLIFSKNSLFKVDGERINIEDILPMKLYYYSAVEGDISVTLISDKFIPIFPDQKALTEEVDLMLSLLSKNVEVDTFGYINDYICDAYGRTNTANVEEWYNKYNRLKTKE